MRVTNTQAISENKFTGGVQPAKGEFFLLFCVEYTIWLSEFKMGKRVFNIDYEEMKLVSKFEVFSTKVVRRTKCVRSRRKDPENSISEKGLENPLQKETTKKPQLVDLCAIPLEF